MKKINITIIGGGASGILAAIFASKPHTKVTILEKNAKLGKKILATGNGRCNFTNINATANDYNHPYFVEEAFKSFSPLDTLSYFDQLGITPKIEDLGKTYPLSEQAASIVDVLIHELKHKNVEIVTEATVTELIKQKQGFLIKLKDGRFFNADQVILSTGGKAMPNSGSDGSGYLLAKSLGHQVTHLFPALVKLVLSSPYLKQLDGVKIPGKVQLLDKNEVIQEETGDILFTKYGISGPTILQISRKANAMLNQHERVVLKVILVNQVTKDDIEKRFIQQANKTIDFSLVGLINKKLILPLLKEADIKNPHALLSTLSQKEKNKLISLLFDWRFLVVDTKGFEDAQVTAGGINLDEINPLTMESKRVTGLYFTGEILDIDGLCGGYNLQWAWSSAYVAGNEASKVKHI